MFCKDCIHFDVCKYKDEKVSIGTKVEELVSDDFTCFKNKADFAEVKHGEWLHKNGEMICSVCEEEALMDEVYYESPYCPDCGAKMDGNRRKSCVAGTANLITKE